jgi:hypothetical protein
MWARAAVGTAVALSAFLLFTVELLAARHVLPRFGGAAAVWLACLVFFQVLLLVGYAWSRLLAEWSAGRQRLHLAVLAAGAAALAVQQAAWGAPLLSPADAPARPGTWAVLLHLARAAGLPFLALAATAPLLQAWEARRGALKPWRLYSLSNAGALAALAAYPFVIEPLLGLKAQAFAWAFLFALDVALLGWATWARAGAQPVEQGTPAPPPAAALRWLALSAGGSFALAAVTNFQTHDLTPAPLLWALPLAVYLVSFIVTFEHERWYRRDVAVGLVAAGLLGVVWCMARDGHGLLVRCLAFGAFELGVCLLCHGEVYRLRPGPAHLGRFYLWLAVGGALGTVAVSVAFPLLTRDYLEFPALVALAGLAAVAVLPGRAVLRTVGALCLVALVAAFFYVWDQRREGQAFSARNFFGVLRVERDGDSWVLIHGGTVHGRQLLGEDVASEPNAYFARQTGLGQTVAALRARKAAPLHAAVLGLGIGTSVALFAAGDDVVFYEIDPEVVDLAEGKGGWFGYLRGAAASWRVELGDARTMLAVSPPPAPVDLLVVDVFSGDAVPMHLLTEEAFRLYLEHLAPDGVIALHVSNRFFDLDRVALALAPRLGLTAVAYQNPPLGLAADARWVLMARTQSALPPIVPAPKGRVWRDVSRPAPWTDDRSSLVHVLR